jgi:acyl-CoA synthetase (AMP-forming)/AMP-acid ligase II
MRRFELKPFLANIEKYEINEFLVVPPIVIAIIKSGLGDKYSLKTIRSVQIGAAPLGRASQERFRQMLPPSALVNQVWGMTETTCLCLEFNWPEKDDTGSVGRLIPNMEAKYGCHLPVSPLSFLIGNYR